MRGRLSIAFIFIFIFITITPNLATEAQENLVTEPLHVFGEYGGLADYEWSPDSSTLAVSTYTGIVLYDAWFNELAFLEPPSEVKVTSGLKWHSDGTQLASVGGRMFPNGETSDDAYIWDIETGEIIFTLPAPADSQIQFASWSPDSTYVLFAIDNKQTTAALVIWETATGNTQEIDVSALGVQARNIWTWSDDEQSVSTVVGTDEFILSLNDPSQIEQKQLVSIENGVFYSPTGTHKAVSEDGVFIVSGPNSPIIELKGDEEGRFQGYREIAWSANGKRVGVWGRPVIPNLMVADVNTGDILLEFTYDSAGTVRSVEFSPDGSVIAIHANFEELIIYDLVTGAHSQQIFNVRTTSVSFSPDGSKLASVNGGSQQVYIWDTATGALLDFWETPNDPKGNTNFLFTVAWSPDGNYVATGAVAGGPVNNPESRPIDLFIWSAEVGEVEHIVPAVAYDVDIITELDWSADSQILAYSTRSNQTGKSHIGVYYLPTATILWQVPLEVSVVDIALRPSGDILTLATVGLSTNSQNLIFLDAQSGEVLDEIIFEDYNQAILRSIDWHPDGKYLGILLDEYDVAYVQIGSWESTEAFAVTQQFDLEGEVSRSSLEWNNQGTQLATWSINEEKILGVQVWDVDIETNTAGLHGLFLPDYPTYFLPFASFDALAWSADGSMIATSLTINTTSIWEVK